MLVLLGEGGGGDDREEENRRGLYGGPLPEYCSHSGYRRRLGDRRRFDTRVSRDFRRTRLGPGVLHSYHEQYDCMETLLGTNLTAAVHLYIFILLVPSTAAAATRPNSATHGVVETEAAKALAPTAAESTPA